MDRKSQKQAAIEELIRISSEARSQIGGKVQRVRHQLDLPARIRDSLRHKPLAWLTGSMVAGVTTSILFKKRSHRRQPNRGLAKKALALTLTAARPLAKVWLNGKLRNWTGTMMRRRQESRSPHSPLQLETTEYPDNARTPGP